MPISDETRALVAEINKAAKGALSAPADFGLLLDHARAQGLTDDFDRLAFLAKFVTRTRGIMQRIGPTADGYERLSAEFSRSLEEVTGLLKRLIEATGPEDRATLTTRYLAKNISGLEKMTLLLSDLTRYKNWRIDNPKRPL